MPGIVLELQYEASSPNVGVSDLLRKALLVAKKLDLLDLENWLHRELNGYVRAGDVPPYRILHGQLVARDGLGRWLPVTFYSDGDDDPGWEEILTRGYVLQSAGELEDLLSRGYRSLRMALHPAVREKVSQGAGEQHVDARLEISNSQVRGILEVIRNTVLEWSLSLEKEGILGEQMTFTPQEKQAAATRVYNVENLISINTMLGSQIQQGTDKSTQRANRAIYNPQELKTILKEIRNVAASITLSSADHQDVEAEIATIEAQLTSSRPKLSVMSESLHTISALMSQAPDSPDRLQDRIDDALMLLGE